MRRRARSRSGRNSFLIEKTIHRLAGGVKTIACRRLDTVLTNQVTKLRLRLLLYRRLIAMIALIYSRYGLALLVSRMCKMEMVGRAWD